MSDELTDFRQIWVKAVALAWHDPAFKAALLKDPRAALQSGFGYALPADLELHVVEDPNAITPIKLGAGSASVVLLLDKPAAVGADPVSFTDDRDDSRSICVC